MNDQPTKHCNRCDASLSAIEAQSDTCNRCLDLGYASLSDEEYDAQEDAAIDRVLRPSLSKTRVYAIALFLAITQTPAGCAITGHTSEGFPVATCADGSHIVADMDGAGGYNSGLPYVIPGTWVELP
jgi:hypothetical protein